MTIFAILLLLFIFFCHSCLQRYEKTDRVIDLFDDVIVLAKDSARTGRLAFYGSIEDARKFFGRDRMEEIVKAVNRREEGGDGLADEFVMKYAEVQHG